MNLSWSKIFYALTSLAPPSSRLPFPFTMASIFLYSWHLLWPPISRKVDRWDERDWISEWMFPAKVNYALHIFTRICPVKLLFSISTSLISKPLGPNTRIQASRYRNPKLATAMHMSLHHMLMHDSAEPRHPLCPGGPNRQLHIHNPNSTKRYRIHRFHLLSR